MTEYEYKELWRVIRSQTKQRYETILSRKNHNFDNKIMKFDGFSQKYADTGDAVYCCLSYFEQMFRDVLNDTSITATEYISMQTMFESIVRRRYAVVHDPNMRFQGVYQGEVLKVQKAVWRWYHDRIEYRLKRGDNVSEQELMIANWDLPF